MKKYILTLLLLTLALFSPGVRAQDSIAPHDSVLSPRDLRLQEIVITGARNDVDARHLPLTVSVLRHEQIAQRHTANILPSLSELVPNLFVTARGVLGYGVSGGGSGAITVRGLGGAAGRLMVLIDGHPQYQGIFGHPIADNYNNLMVERVEVLRGPASLLYGSNAMGGVVNIVTRHKHNDGSSTDASISAGSYATAEAEISNQIRKKKFHSTIAAQYGRSNNHRPNMEFEQYNAFARLGWEFSPNWKIFGDAGVTHFHSQNPGTVSAPLLEAEQWITRGNAAIVLENSYEKVRGSVSIYDNFGFHKINDGYAQSSTPQENFFRSQDHLLGVSAFQTMTLFSGSRITLGIDYQHIYGDAYYESRETGERTTGTSPNSSATNHRNEIAGYVEVLQDLFGWLTINAGLRIDHHSIAGTEFIPQAGFAVRMPDNADLKATVSKGFRNPTMRELYLYPPANDSLKAEKMWNYELAWKQRLKNVPITYGLNIFYLQAENIIQTVPINGKPRNINSGKLNNAGAEAEMSYYINEHFSINTNHGYLYMKNPVVAAPQYKGHVGAHAQWKKFHAQVGLQYIYGLYTTVSPTKKQQDFWLLNATIAFRPIKNVELFIRGDNLLAQKYEINDGFPMPKATAKGGITLKF